MHVLVTGADGFVGRHLLAHLAACGDTVTKSTADIVDRDATIVDFADSGADAVYHLAAQADVGGSWDQPVQTLRVNAEGTMNVLDAARMAGIERVLAVTSADVYGMFEDHDLPLTETQPLRPASPYAASKAAADMICLQAFLGRGLDVVRVRSFNHLGPGQGTNFVASAIASRIAECERTGHTTVRVGNLEARRDFTDVRDVVRAYRSLMCDGQAGEAYHVCSGTDRPIRELASILVSRSTAPVELAVDPDLFRPVDLKILRGDNTKTTQQTGWSPSIPIETTLEDLLDYWRQNAQGEQTKEKS